MRREPVRASALLLSLFLCAWTATAGFLEMTEGVWVDDFEDEILLDWQTAPGVTAEVVREAGNAELHVLREGAVDLFGHAFPRFDLHVDIHGSGGVRFGGRYAAWIDGDSVLLQENGQTVAQAYPGSRDPEFDSNDRHRLGVVCADTLVGVYLDGERLLQKADARATGDAIALLAGPRGGLFDNVRIAASIPPSKGTAAVPREEDDALVFSAVQEAGLNLDVVNMSARDLKLVAAVRAFTAEPFDPAEGEKVDTGATVMEFGVEHLYRIQTLPDRTAARAEQAAAAGKRSTAMLNLGRIPAGFYMLDLTFRDGPEPIGRQTYPFAVFEDVAPRAFAPPAMPIGAYTHYVIRRRKGVNDPVWINTYLHALALRFKQHNFSAVVACGAFEPAVVEIFNRYGVAVLQRGDRHLGHPGIIGTLLGDEPKRNQVESYVDEYAAAVAKTDKPVLTACVGEGIGLGGKYFFWDQVQPPVRAFRWYGIKKHFYGVQYPVYYKGILPLHDMLRIADESFETPYWGILPGLGGTQHEAYYQLPFPAQAAALMHLYAANGAGAQIFWTYMGGPGLVHPVTLEPRREGLIERITEVAGWLGQHAELLNGLDVGGMDVRCRSPYIEPIPLHNDAGEQYVYTVNRNTREPVTCRLFWPASLPFNGAHDLFATADVTVGNDGRYRHLDLQLRAGDGVLIEMKHDE